MDVTQDAVLLLDDRHGIEQLLAFTRQADTVAALQALGEGIFANRLWDELGNAKLVARAFPEPLLAIFGNFTSAERVQLSDLAAQLNEVIGKHRYIDYPTAEIYAERLAQKLMGRFGGEALSHFQFTGIPRGGGIALGMLAYLLDLHPDQIISGSSASTKNGDTLVVVDDCALSGVRFQQFLEKVTFSRVVFCPLFATPELCRAIEQAEPRIEACINAEDLHDVAPARFDEAYSQWCAERKKLMGQYGYWAGITEYIAFAWCEPQTKYWSQSTERFEPGWNVLPPNLSLKRRVLAAKLKRERGDAGRQAQLTLQPDGPGPLTAANRVLWTEIGSAIAVAHMPQGALQTTPCFRLEGTAADMWRSMLEYGSLEAAEASLLRRYDVEPAILRYDLATFVSDLESHGILTRGCPYL